MKVYKLYLTVAVVLTILADLYAGDVLHTWYGTTIILLVLASGLFFFLAGLLGPGWVLATVIGNAAFHTLFWFIATNADTRTFWGGAMMPAFAFLFWGIVTVYLGVTGLVRLLFYYLHKRERDRKQC